jgi:hypothetical protein
MNKNKKVNTNLNFWLLSFAISILIFFGVTGTVPFLLHEYLNINFYNSWISVVLSFVISFIISKHIKGRTNVFDKDKSGKLFTIFIIIFTAFVVIRGLYIPLQGWDALTLYDSRAKMFLGGVKLKEMTEFSRYDDYNQLYYFSYPPLTSTIHAVFYSFGFENIMVIYGLFYAAYAVFIYLFLDQNLSKDVYKILLFLLAVANPYIFEQTVIAYTNLPAMAFQIGALFLIYCYSKSQNSYDLFLSALFLAFSNWTRSLEPLFIIFFPIVIYVVNKIKKYNLFKKLYLISMYIVTSLSLRVLWKSFLSLNIGQLEGTTPTLGVIITKISESIYLANFLDVALFIYLSMLPIIPYLTAFFVVLGIKIILTKKYNDMQLIIATLVVGILITMILGTLYFSVSFKWWNQIQGSLLRSNFILIPLTVLYLAFALGEKEDRRNKH